MMKKSTKGQILLSSGQIQATRLNKLEYQRLQRHVHFLRDDLQEHLARIQREEKNLKLHFKNVVRVIKPNRAYQLWKQAHAQEIAQDEAKELIESFKRQQKFRPKTSQQTMFSTTEAPSELFRPLLLLVEDKSKKSVAPIINFAENFLRPKSSPITKHSSTLHPTNPLLTMLDGNSNNLSQSLSHRVNPLLTTMLRGRPASSNVYRQKRPEQYDSPSFYSLSSVETPSTRKLIQGQCVPTHTKSELDALYRMALQNQTAYKGVDRTRIDDRKLHDKEFASRHRALKGSMRSASVVN